MIDRRTLLAHGMAMGTALLPSARAWAGGRMFSCPVMLEGARLLLDAEIASRRERFVIDTGAPWSLIDDQLAKSLKLKAIPGRRVVIGVGGISEYPWYDAGEVRFGAGIRLPNMLFVGARPGILGREIAGSFGAGLFTSYDSDLDMNRAEWRSYPDGRPSYDGLHQLKSRRFRDSPSIGGDMIVADASLGGFSGEFLLDTGAPGMVSLDRKASLDSGLWDDSRPYVPVSAGGIGESRVRARLVRADKLQIGPFGFVNPVVKLFQSGGALRRDGVIGLGTLRALNLTMQASSGTVWAATSGLDPAEGRYPMSGLWVDGEGKELTIAVVGTGSPAAEAGLKPGDRIVGNEFRALLRQITGPAGTQVPLTIERAGKRQDVSLTLKPYL